MRGESLRSLECLLVWLGTTRELVVGKVDDARELPVATAAASIAQEGPTSALRRLRLC